MPRFIEVLTFCTCCSVLSFLVLRQTGTSPRADTHAPERMSAYSVDEAAPVQIRSASSDQKPHTEFAVAIRSPSGPPQIRLAGNDPQGRSASVACSTCHAIREPNLANVSADMLDEFHQGMVFHHGKITCYACHNPTAADSLRLADGSAVEYRDVLTLCAQCHGPQATAFAHGAHGGMNGHWDLTRGPQNKNNCVDCHDPHAPAYPKMIVGFKPQDRFNHPTHSDTQHSAPQHSDTQHQGNATDEQH